jgi:hypothetical protein
LSFNKNSPLSLTLSARAELVLALSAATTRPARFSIEDRLSVSQSLSGWQLIEIRATLLCHEGFLQAYWLYGRRSDPLAMHPS